MVPTFFVKTLVIGRRIAYATKRSGSTHARGNHTIKLIYRRRMRNTLVIKDWTKRIKCVIRRALHMNTMTRSVKRSDLVIQWRSTPRNTTKPLSNALSVRIHAPVRIILRTKHIRPRTRMGRILSPGIDPWNGTPRS